VGIAGSIMVLTIAWWIAFQAMLPFGVRSHQEEGTVIPGTEPSAPVSPNLGRKAIYAGLVALVVWGALFALIEFQVVSLDDIPTSLNLP
jgi:predicted secreted protein